MGLLEKEASDDFRSIVLGHELSELGDSSLLPLLYVNAAHVNMLERQGLIPPDTARALLGALRLVGQEGLRSLDTAHTEDLYFALEQKLITELGIQRAGNIHIGRSRNDIYSTVYRMILRERLLETSTALGRLSKTVLAVADRLRDAVMPGYTHTQHAQAVTAGYYFLAFFEVLERDMERLRRAWEAANRCPLGAAAITTTSFPLDRDYTSRLLAFDGIVCNAYDAISGRDYVNDAALALNTLATDLSRVVADLMAWNMSEFGFLEIPDEYAVISSIMPQKKNPACLEFLRSAASWVLGDTVAVVSSPKAVTYSDIRDATKYLYSPLWHALEVTGNMLRLFDELLPLLRWDRERMYALTAEGYSTMTDLADHLVARHGITFREAHGVVANFVKASLREKRKSDHLDAEALNRLLAEQGFPFRLSQDELESVLDPRGCLERRDVEGGTSPRQMARMLTRDREVLSRHSRWLAEQEARLREIPERLFLSETVR